MVQVVAVLDTNAHIHSVLAGVEAEYWARARLVTMGRVRLRLVLPRASQAHTGLVLFLGGERGGQMVNNRYQPPAEPELTLRSAMCPETGSPVAV